MTEAFDHPHAARAIAAAQGKEPFDLLLTGGRVVDVATLELREADVGIVGADDRERPSARARSTAHATPTIAA